MPPPPELVAALHGRGLTGAGRTEFELVFTLFAELILETRARRAQLLKDIGDIGQRYLLDSVDACPLEVTRALAVETWMVITRRIGAAAAVRRYHPADLFDDPLSYIFEALRVRRCILDDLLHFGMGVGADFCQSCQTTLTEVGLSLPEVREKIRLGQKIH